MDYLRSEVMAATGATRHEIQGLLTGGVVQQDHPRDGTLYRWSRDEIVLLAVAVQLARMGMPRGCIRAAIDAVRRARETGAPAVMVFRFDDTGRFASAARLNRADTWAGEVADRSDGASGSRLLIDIEAEARAVDTRLRQHRAIHGPVRRGPKPHHRQVA